MLHFCYGQKFCCILQSVRIDLFELLDFRKNNYFCFFLPTEKQLFFALAVSRQQELISVNHHVYREDLNYHPTLLTTISSINEKLCSQHEIWTTLVLFIGRKRKFYVFIYLSHFIKYFMLIYLHLIHVGFFISYSEYRYNKKICWVLVKN